MRFVWLSLAVTACGLDHPTSEQSPTMPSELEPAGDVGAHDEPPIDELTPHVCGVHAWTTPANKSDDDVLAVAAMPHGATLLTVPRTGGDVVAFQIDEDGHLLGKDHRGTVLAHGNFDHVSATYTDQQLLASVGRGTTGELIAIRPDLGQVVTLSSLKGGVSAGTPVTDARSRHLAPIATADGIFVQPFDLQWHDQPRELAVLDEVIGFAAQPYGTGETMLAWSTPDSCNAMYLSTKYTGSRPGACRGVALATDLLANSAEMVFERDGVITTGDIRFGAQDILTSEHALVAGTSPRIQFDGAHYWVSLIDSKGDPVVGVLDDDGRFHSGGALRGLTPNPHAHQLAQIDGQMWLFTVDHRGFVGYQMCL